MPPSADRASSLKAGAITASKKVSRIASAVSPVDRPVQPHDPAVGGHRIRIPGHPEGLGQGRGAGHAGWFVVLDHHRRCSLELRSDPQGGIQVEDVIEGEFRPLDLAGARQAVGRACLLPVEGSLLVRVLPVAQTG